jgi:hypothetical protein
MSKINPGTIDVTINTYWTQESDNIGTFYDMRDSYNELPVDFATDFEYLGFDGKYQAMFWIRGFKPTKLIKRIKNELKT